MTFGQGKYNRTEAADITETGAVVVLDTGDRPFVSATLKHAANASNYTVQVSQANSATMADWTNVSAQTSSTAFRFQDTIPERFVRIFQDAVGSAVGSDTGDFEVVAVY